MTPGDLSSFSLWDLFRAEVETHSTTLNEGLLALEQHPTDLDRIKALMRAAHSIKGAARVVQHSAAVDVAHAMEDRLVAAQEGRQALSADDIQNLLDAVDLIGRLSPPDETSRDGLVATVRADTERLVGRLRHARPGIEKQTMLRHKPRLPLSLRRLLLPYRLLLPLIPQRLQRQLQHQRHCQFQRKIPKFLPAYYSPFFKLYL